MLGDLIFCLATWHLQQHLSKELVYKSIDPHLIKVFYVFHLLLQIWHMFFDCGQLLHEISKPLDVCLLVCQHLKDNRVQW